MTLKETFQAQAMAQAQTAMLAHGCPTKRLIQNLEAHGIDAVKQQVARHRVSDGFDALASCGHLELTPEALMTKGKYGALFTDEEINWCLQVLIEAGYF